MGTYVWSAAPYTAKDPSTVDIVTLPLRYVPLLLLAIERQKDRRDWTSETDWEQGYTDLCAIQWEMLMGGNLQELIESNRQIYRLLDTSLNGRAYTAVPDPEAPEELIISPDIPPAPANPSPATLPPYALRRRFERLVNLTDNQATGAQFALDPAWLSDGALSDEEGLRATLRAMQGIINAGWFGIGGEKATIADVVTALRIGSPDDAATIDTALEALSVASSSANVFAVVRQLLTDVTSVGLEGATLGTLIAASIANAATQGILAGQLDRIIAALDGGGPAAPEGNVLDTLKSVDGTLDNVETLLS